MQYSVICEGFMEVHMKSVGAKDKTFSQYNMLRAITGSEYVNVYFINSLLFCT
jgi:hypothetical protein